MESGQSADLFEGAEAMRMESAADPVKTVCLNYPEIISYWIEKWPEYVDAIRAAEEAVGSLRAGEKRAGGCRGSAFSWNPLGRDSIRSLARDGMAVVTAYALKTLCNDDESVFSSHQASCIMSECDCLKKPEEPDFGAYWEALVDKYGAGQGEAIALRKAAERTRNRLNILKAGEKENRRFVVEPKVERGGVTFTLWNSIVEPCYSGGGYEVRFDSVRMIADLLEDLSLLFVETGPLKFQMCEFERLRNAHLKLPYRFQVGAFKWGLFTSKTTIWMPMETALELKAQIEEHDPDGCDSE